MAQQRCSILIADDDKYIRDDLGDLLAETGHRLYYSATAAETWQGVVEHCPDLVLLDIRFPDLNDLTLLQRIKAEYPETQVVILTSQTDNVPRIVSAIKFGAFDYVAKPFVPDELKNRVAKALELRSVSKSRDRMLNDLQSQNGLACLTGESAAMRSIHDVIRRMAVVDSTVLILGESGTGKELAAKALHYLSGRRNSPFIAVNCAAIPEALLTSELFGHKKGAFTGAVESARGKFDIAEDGTIFLDEIGDMPLAQQTALLRVLEQRTYTPVGDSRERECRARFIFATNCGLKERVEKKTFRSDLYYRINVGTLNMPALREHTEDIPVLVDHLSAVLCAAMGRKPVKMNDSVIEILKRYDWPGNVRELRNILERTLILLDPNLNEVSAQHLPADLLAATSNATLNSADLHEREKFISTLHQCGGNQSQAAKVLGVHRNTIRARIRYYGLESV